MCCTYILYVSSILYHIPLLLFFGRSSSLARYSRTCERARVRTTCEPQQIITHGLCRRRLGEREPRTIKYNLNLAKKSSQNPQRNIY